MRKNVAFVVPYPQGMAPSQRFRIEHYLPYLKENGIGFKYLPLTDEHGYKIIQREGHVIGKVAIILKGFFRRVKLLFQLYHFDVVFVHREVFPVGPPVFEFIISRIFKKRMIYDFDDAIFIPDEIGKPRIIKWIKNTGKVAKICRWASVVSCGNDFLAEFAKRYNDSVRIIPTVVDTDHAHREVKDQAIALTIGWTGSHSTLIYLEEIYPVIMRLQQEVDFEFIIIADRDPAPAEIHYRFIPWREETEISDLLAINIGIMPLRNTAWARGKCGFKAIQYLSLGIPAVVSDVGVNSKIVDDGINGYVIKQSDQWYNVLKDLLLSQSKRAQMGRDGREKIVRNYSVSSMLPEFIKLFEVRERS